MVDQAFAHELCHLPFAMGRSQLLLLNPFMPEAVAKVHLVETATSNFLFGVLVGWLLALPRISIGFSLGRGSTVWRVG